MAVDINDPDAFGGGTLGGSLHIPHNANPNESPQISFGGWFNLQSNAGFPAAVAIDNGGWDRGIHLNGNNWGIASGGNTDAVAPAPTGLWTYVMGTFDKPANVATLYVGTDVAAVQTTLSGTRPDAGVNPGEVQIEIGRYNNQDLDSLVDDFTIWNEALTVDEANAIRNLRLNSTLDYSPADAEILFDLFDSGSGSVTVKDTEWSVGAVTAVFPGQLTDLGTGDFTLRLDGNGNGLIGAAADSGGGGGGGAAVPEPTTLAIWTLLGIVGVAFAGRNLRRRARV